MADSTLCELAGGKLLVDRPSEGIVRLTISNPGKRNALDQEMLDAITVALAQFEREPEEARCVMVTGAGRMFSAGYAIAEITNGQFQEEAERLVAHPFTAAIEALEAFPRPTLAALPGHTIGGGLELALACDLRIATDAVELGMPPAKLGLVYSHTGLRRFIDTVGVARTRELFLLGSYIDADTALGWGLLNRVVPAEDLDEAALGLARGLAANAPLAQVGNKRVISALVRARTSLASDVEQELIELRRKSFESEDLREGMRAFAEKRPPRWRGE